MSRRQSAPAHPLVGRYVQLHPATDSWMRGDRYGTVDAVMRDGQRFKIHLFRSGKTKVFSRRNFEIVD